MTTFVVTGGVSALTNIARNSSDLDRRVREVTSEIDPARTDPREWAASITGAAAAEALPQLRTELMACRLSAELSGIQATHGPRRDEAELVVLLVSDTDAGRAAAALNAAFLADGWEYSEGSPWTAPAQVGHRQAGQPKVNLCIVPGLTVEQPHLVHAAMEHVGRILAWVADRRESRECVLHLAGGFKPTIPLLVPLAEYLEGLGEIETLTVAVKHELGERAVEVPLRRPQRENVQAGLQAIADGRTTRRGVEELEGFAYRQTVDGLVLTAIGRGLLCLLATHAASRADV